MNATHDDNRFMDHLLFRSLKGLSTQAEEEKVREWRSTNAANEAHYRELGRLLEVTAVAYTSADDAAWTPPDAATLAGLPPRSGSAGGGGGGRELSTWLRRWPIALGAVALFALWLVLPDAGDRRDPELLSFGVNEFATGSTDVATVQLRDGTVVRLGPDSRLRLTGAPGEREVWLDGRAYFAVAKLAGHPFHVRTRGGDAVVLGTRFEAEARGEELRLLVVEGRVALAAAAGRVELGAGQTARAFEGAVSSPHAVADVRELLGWTDNLLIFQATPIAEVAEEMRRHFDMHIEVVGPNLGEHTVTAWFADATAADVLRVVCKVLAATCTTDESHTTIDLSPAAETRRTP